MSMATKGAPTLSDRTIHSYPVLPRAKRTIFIDFAYSLVDSLSSRGATGSSVPKLASLGLEALLWRHY